MGSSYDAIVVGGGHNGLVAAAYLARVRAAHRRARARGDDRRRGDDRAAVAGRPGAVGDPAVLRDEPDAARRSSRTCSSSGTATGCTRWGPTTRRSPRAARSRSTRTTRQRTHDADREVVARTTPTRCRSGTRGSPGWPTCSDRCCSTVPPDDRLAQPRRPRRTRCGWPGATAASTSAPIADVTRLMTMSIADLLDDWFESPQVKGALAVNGVIGTWAGPYEPGTAYVMAHHSIGDVGDGQLGSWGFPEGGMGAVVRRDPPLCRGVRRRGAHRRPGGAGCSSTTAASTARCSRTARSCARRIVVTSLHPQTAFLDQRRPRRTCPTTSSATSSAGARAAAS